MPGSGPPSWWVNSGRVAQHEYLGMTRDGAVGLDDGAAHVIERGVERLRIGLATLPAAQMTVWVGMVQPAATTETGANIGDHGLGAYFHAEPAQVELGLVAEARADRKGAAGGRPPAA